VSSDFDIHGKDKPLPDGYHWVIPSPVLCRGLADGIIERETIHIAKSQSYLKMATSVVQLVLSSITLYRSRGSQLDRYGYAAFGLSVLPYTFMSLVNFIYVGVVGEYPALTMLQTETLQEANRRVGGKISGEIGTLKVFDDARDSDEDAKRPEDAGEVDIGDVEAPQLKKGAKAGGGESKLVSFWKEDSVLFVKIRGITRKFKLVDDDENPSLKFGIHPVTPTLDIHEPDDTPRNTIIPSISLRQLLKERLDTSRGVINWISLRLTLILVFVAPILACVLPEILIAIWTGYKKGQSTPFQRAVIVLWLLLNQLTFISAPGQLLHKFKRPTQENQSPWSGGGLERYNQAVNMRRAMRGGGRRRPSIGCCGVCTMCILGICTLLAMIPVMIFWLFAMLLALISWLLVPLAIIFVFSMYILHHAVPIAGLIVVGKMVKEFGTCSID